MDKKSKEEENKTFLKEYRDTITDYVEERLELTHLNAIEKTAILTGKLSVGALMLALGLFALFFLNIFLAIIIGDLLNNRAYGFMIITGFYLLLLVIALLLKSKLEMPITNFVVRQLMHKNKQAKS